MNGNRKDRSTTDGGRSPSDSPIGKGDTSNIAGSDVQQPEIAEGPVAGLQPGERVERDPWRPPVEMDPPPGYGRPPGGALGAPKGSKIIKSWPEESREAAQLVIDAYGEPQEATASLLTWHDAGPWKRVMASRAFHQHAFPAPHSDSVASFIDYQVPPADLTPLAQFDGSVIVDRTAGEVSARCHDEQANFLALNLVHDIVSHQRSVADARDYYAREFVDHRRGKPTPYMEGLRFTPGQDTADPDRRVLLDEDLDERAVEEGRHQP